MMALELRSWWWWHSGGCGSGRGGISHAIIFAVLVGICIASSPALLAVDILMLLVFGVLNIAGVFLVLVLGTLLGSPDAGVGCLVGGLSWCCDLAGVSSWCWGPQAGLPVMATGQHCNTTLKSKGQSLTMGL